MRSIPTFLALAACLAAPAAIAGQAASEATPGPAVQAAAQPANPRPRSVVGQVMAELTRSLHATTPATAPPASPALATRTAGATNTPAPDSAGSRPQPGGDD